MCATRDIAQGEELSVDFYAHLPDSGISACRPAPDAHARVSVCQGRMPGSLCAHDCALIHSTIQSV